MWLFTKTISCFTRLDLERSYRIEHGRQVLSDPAINRHFMQILFNDDDDFRLRGKSHSS